MPALAQDLSALTLSLELASVVTVLLLALGTPLAWWLARTPSRWRGAVGAVVSLPLVLPPTVLGFYLLVSLGPEGPLGRLTLALGLGLLPFHFSGLVLGSCLYCLPFVVQPLRSAFLALGERPLEAALCLRAGPVDRFFTVVLPQVRPALLVAAVLSFAHTLGEFGIVLMIGGNIPGRTRVLSMQIYDHVEALEYAPAHWLSGGLVVLAFCALYALHRLEPQRRLR